MQNADHNYKIPQNNQGNSKINLIRSRLLIDTPEKYNQLKQGQCDNKYRYVDITTEAHPDVLLQPQFFWNASFVKLKFISSNEYKNNAIQIFPISKRAEIHFNIGDNPMSGVPNNYNEFFIYYWYPMAIPTDENINSILNWTEATRLRIYENQGHAAIKLMESIDKLDKLTKLNHLTLYMGPHTYDKINVATFIGNLSSLNEIIFIGNDISDDQVKEFMEKNATPSNWRVWTIDNVVTYNKHDE